MGNAARSEDHPAGLAAASVGKEQWIVDTEIAFEADAIIRPKNRRDEGYEANTVMLARDATPSAATIRRRRRTPPITLSARPCVSARPLRGRSGRFVQVFEVLGSRPAARRALRGVALIKPLEIVIQPLVGIRDELSQRTTGEVSVLIFDCPLRVLSTAGSSRS
jgi:hypothetical protein